MNRTLLISLFIFVAWPFLPHIHAQSDINSESVALRADKNYAIVIHGGAGAMEPGRYSKQQEEAYLISLDRALSRGEQLLESGEAALDVVEQVIIILENDSLFNAGRGAVLTAEGRCELDASVMDGRDKTGGAVSGVTNVKNPIKAARLVMEKTPHVLLSAEAANSWAFGMGLERVPNSYFITQKRQQKYDRMDKKGTVGCVVLDRNGNLAAGTSTGGMTGKAWGRIGDSPIIGAGTYADNASCAISATGHGEYFIKESAAFQVHARMIYGGESLEEATRATLEVIDDLGGKGGLIAVDAEGNVSMPFTTKGMFRAASNRDGRMVKIYK
jgi:beta-aspartyl-peptidase (threonine type)